jgi:hypothetical protein
MYISKQLSFKIRDDLAQNIEDDNKFEIFENAINTILYKVERENKICYLAGDYNIDLLKSESCDFSNRFIEQLFTSSFFPLINKPTRITAVTVIRTSPWL